MYSNTRLAMAELPAPGLATDMYSASCCLANNAAHTFAEGVLPSSSDSSLPNVNEQPPASIFYSYMFNNAFKSLNVSLNFSFLTASIDFILSVNVCFQLLSL